MIYTYFSPEVEFCGSNNSFICYNNGYCANGLCVCPYPYTGYDCTGYDYSEC